MGYADILAPQIYTQKGEKMKKLLLILLMLTMLTGAFTLSTSALFGSGADVVASDVNLVKTGLLGQNISFSDTDFKTALGISEFEKIIITALPSSTEGTLMVGERRAYTGQAVKRKNLDTLVFIPNDKNVAEALFKFKTNSSENAEILCKMRFIDRINYAPKINTDANQTLNVTTQTGISVYGQIEASDPEGDDIDYIIVSYPKHGTLRISNSERGEFCYTPSADYDGKDSFVFVVRDEYGNYSSPEKVSLKVTERMSEVVYVDMENSKSYNAAVVMTAMGIMSGSRVGDDMYFTPEGRVTRAEFVAMAMKSLGIRADSTLTETFFDDNDEIPKSLVSYVATAAKCGIVNGSLEFDGLKFRPTDAITNCEAAIIMSNLLDVKSDYAVFSEINGIETVPVWARGHVGAMYSSGIFSQDTSLDINEALTRENVAEYLYRMMNFKNK